MGDGLLKCYVKSSIFGPALIEIRVLSIFRKQFGGSERVVIEFRKHEVAVVSQTWPLLASIGKEDFGELVALGGIFFPAYQVVWAWVGGKKEVSVVEVHPFCIRCSESSKREKFRGDLKVASGEKSERFREHCQQVSDHEARDNSAQ